MGGRTDVHPQATPPESCQKPRWQSTRAIHLDSDRMNMRRRRSEWMHSFIHRVYESVAMYGAIGPGTSRGRRFAKFGEGSVICFPHTTIFNEAYIEIGRNTMIGPNVALSAGMVPGQECVTKPVVRIGDRCLIGRGSGIVGHLAIDIGDDVWTGHHVYITDQNHGYEDPDAPVGWQRPSEAAVSIGSGSWLGANVVILPGTNLGRNTVVAAGAVVRGSFPDRVVLGGVPAKILRAYDETKGWHRPGE